MCHMNRLLVWAAIVLICPASSAWALGLDSVTPNRGEIGKSLRVTLAGNGFDERSRIFLLRERGDQRRIVGATDAAIKADAVDVSGRTAVVLGERQAENGTWTPVLMVIDVRDPTAPVMRGSVEIPDYSGSVTMTETTAYVGDGYHGLQAIDVRDRSNPVTIGSVADPVYAPLGAGDITVFSEMPADGVHDHRGTVTLNHRLVEHRYLLE